MSAAAIGITFFLVMMVLIFLGVPIFVSLMVCSCAGLFLLGGAPLMVTTFSTVPINQAASYSFAVLPLFMLVGTLAGETGIAGGAYSAMNRWMGRQRGGILIATVAANAIFGACSGISVAGNVVFGKIAMPELEKHGYDRKTSLGCIVAAGSLSSLIPPSIVILIFTIMSDLSIGRALMGGIGPGLLLALLLVVIIKLIGILRPGKIPEPNRERIPVLEKIKTLRLLLPILALFSIIIGGSFLGWFPATVGGAIGAVAVIIYAFARRMSIKRILYAIWDGAVMNAGMFPIIVAGAMFGRFITFSGLASSLAAAISRIHLPAYCVFLLVVVFYIFCGCVLDIASIIIITHPIVFPLLTGLGFDPYVLVIVLVFMAELAGMTPPIGMNVFATSSALRIKAEEIFAGVVPFFCVELAVVLLIGIFPQIVTFIPNLLS